MLYVIRFFVANMEPPRKKPCRTQHSPEPVYQESLCPESVYQESLCPESAHRMRPESTGMEESKEECRIPVSKNPPVVIWTMSLSVMAKKVPWRLFGEFVTHHGASYDQFAAHLDANRHLWEPTVSGRANVVTSLCAIVWYRSRSHAADIFAYQQLETTSDGANKNPWATTDTFVMADNGTYIKVQKNVNNVIREVLAYFAPMTEEYNISLSSEGDISVTKTHPIMVSLPGIEVFVALFRLMRECQSSKLVTAFSCKLLGFFLFVFKSSDVSLFEGHPFLTLCGQVFPDELNDMDATSRVLDTCSLLIALGRSMNE